ncbi:MAG: CoA transferase [Dehalococcoidia bacterium]|jgi:crotonobetainyl-CoA:carnitine CoA-transferase CaiB-like acyl-CoA transferase
MPGALSGIRVADFSRMYAGPFCSMILRELGAEVIKVEFRESGDACRTIPPITDAGEGYTFSMLNRGKKSITLELKTEEGQKIARELIAKCDVLLENFKPGAMDRLGLGWDDVKKINPGLIYASLSGFGQTGPYAHKPAFDMVAQAMGGLMSVTGFPENPPTKCGPPIADLGGGAYTVIGILAALQHRHSTGVGQHVDISLQDFVWATTAVESLAAYALTGNPPGRIGNMHPGIVPWNVYQARDGYVVLCILTIGHWQKFSRIIGRADLVEDPDQCAMVLRVGRRVELDGIVAAWVKDRTVAEIVQMMDEAELPCSPVLDTAQMVNDPHMKSREMTVEVEQMISGPLKMPGTVFKLSETPGDPFNPAPFLGEHNSEVYTELLGYSEEKLGELMDAEIV